jgi:glycerophosphoryl diester phosphodiesterase
VTGDERSCRLAGRLGFAHRGGRGHGHDNRLETFRGALDRGAAGLETDAWLTADGVVVLDHDGVHRAAERRHKPMSDVRRDELPAHIPSLGELYENCGTDFDVAIDVRLPDVAAAVVDVARAHGAAERLWLVGGTPELLATWQHLDHTGRYAMSIRLVERRRSVVAAAHDAGADALNMRWPWWTRSMVRRVHDAGLLAFAYDVQSAFALRRCDRLGIDGIFSDHVGRLAEWYGGRHD